jgi:glutamate carboxypeptidase
MVKITVVGCAFLLSVIFNVSYAENINPVEKEMVRYLYQQQGNELNYLKQLANINSGSSNLPGIYQVGALLQKEFKQLGFKTYWVYQSKKTKRAGTFIAQRTGQQGSRLLLIGHLDTVFPKNSPFQITKQVGNKLQGPGVIDCKGGDVIILYALKAMAKAGVLNNTSITVVFTGDEEDTGQPMMFVRKPLFEAARNSDIALDFESAVSFDTASIARRGITKWQLSTYGKQAHSSAIFQKNVGDGAIFEMARILNTMRLRLSNVPYLSFNPGISVGGTSYQYDLDNAQANVFGKLNVVAQVALVTGEMRYVSNEQKLKTKQVIKDIVNAHLAQTQAKINFIDNYPAMAPTHNNMMLLSQYSQVSNDLGYGTIKPLDSRLRGAGDISLVAHLTKANLVGMGPVGSGDHTVRETMDISSLKIQTQRAALLIYRLTRPALAQ